MKSIALLGALLAAGCSYSEADVASRPAEWTVSYPVQWRDMANCIGMSLASDYRVTPDMFPAEQRARLTLAATTLSSEEMRGIQPQQAMKILSLACSPA